MFYFTCRLKFNISIPSYFWCLLIGNLLAANDGSWWN
uniref:Uncharacterized protein n=1 Tax=Arundo donax TaxID=35708 RepID=A0A0A8ZIF3_ARUDO